MTEGYAGAVRVGAGVRLRWARASCPGGSRTGMRGLFGHNVNPFVNVGNIRRAKKKAAGGGAGRRGHGVMEVQTLSKLGVYGGHPASNTMNSASSPRGWR